MHVRRTPARAVAALATVTLTLAVSTACTAGPPAPDATAEALADGIASRDLSEVPLGETTADQAEAQITAALAGLDPLRPAVEVGEIVVDDEKGTTATAVLEVTWDVDDGPVDWTYSTTAHLDLVDDEWQAQWSTRLLAPDLREAETLVTRRTAAERARVLGAANAVLVEARPVQRLGLDKTRIAPETHHIAARDIAAVLGIEPDAFAADVAAAGEKAFVEGLVVRAEAPPVDLIAFTSIAGALSVADTLPLAPNRRFARPVLGTAGPATAEIVEASAGAIAAGDMTGLSGLQRQYDEQLRGRPGLSVLAVANDTDPPAERLLFEVGPVAGKALVTTLDPAWQDAAETVLEPVVPASAIVVLRTSTGEVVAAAAGPGSEGYSTGTVGSYPPGSVFKVVSSLALLRAGLSPQSTVECPPTTTVDGRTFSNFPDYPADRTGPITLGTAVAFSCNTAFIGARDQAPASALVEAGASLGLGQELDLGFPAFLGKIPADSTGTDHAASLIGQGRIEASPLAMATVDASVAAGRTVVPWLVGTEAPTAPSPAVPLTAGEAEALRDLLRGVVTEGGATFLGDVPGGEVIAKTGTAQYASGDELRNHAWMIAVQGDLAFAVLVADGEYGSTTAGPLLEQLLTLMAPTA